MNNAELIKILQDERDSARRELEQLKKDKERLVSMFLTVLDHVDYIEGSVLVTEMIGATLPVEVIRLSRKVIDAAMRKETK